MECTWGLLGPEFLSNSRRTRTLGLGASVRLFNDLAVPGIGGVWYGKQLLLATLGVAVAEAARAHGAKVQNIEVTNAIEALACRLAFESIEWKSDSRLRGNTKLQGKIDFSFKSVRQRNFYVTKPMRMSTTQALSALGFVESESVRFNAFRCTDEGKNFINLVTESFSPYNRTVIEHLTMWVQMKDDRVESNALRQALSPLELFPNNTTPLLRERLIQGGKEKPGDKERRGNALKWVETILTKRPDRMTWEQRPKEITEEHWRDLQAGALFFETREAAIAVLDTTEAYIGSLSSGQSYSLNKKIPEVLMPAIIKMKSAANKYLEFKHAEVEANKFCDECRNDDSSRILRTLINRDGHLLRLVGDEVKPGPAFRGSPFTTEQAGADDDDLDTPKAKEIQLPEGISYRVRNLYLLNLDMEGELNGWLNPDQIRSDI